MNNPQQADGYQNMTMRPYPKAVTPERSNRGSSSGLAWIPIEAFGNDRTLRSQGLAGGIEAEVIRHLNYLNHFPEEA